MESVSNDKVETKNRTNLLVYTTRPWELLKTCFLVITWIVLGIHGELVGPTLKILAIQTGVTFTGISTILSVRGGGYMAGSIAGAGMQNLVKQYPEALLSLAFFIASTVVFFTPYIRSLLVLSVLFFCHGIAQGFTDNAGTSLILSMWGDYASTPLNTVHLGFGIGAALANILMAQFLDKGKLDLSNLNLNSTMQNLSSLASTNIKTPYSIAASLCLVVSIGHLIFTISKYHTRHQTLQVQQVNYSVVNTTPVDDIQSSHPRQLPKQDSCCHLNYSVFMSSLWIVHLIFIVAIDQVFAKFFFSYLKLPQFQISTKNASLGMILYWLSYSTGRAICAVITLFLSVDVTLSMLWIGGLALAITWLIYVWTIGLSIFSLFINKRLNVTPLMVGIFLCSSSLGSMSFQRIAGVLMDKNPKHFPTLLIICVLMGILFYCSTFCLSMLHRRPSMRKF
ncbi:unnamed protein product [Rotaria socialis]|uniref:Sodium-dependent glucose transporter 1 n=1 Tax=Rotaria socialis TaxID=392032 RepID=A0A821F1J1_9BILA|nr:unnamed protein product [Rotaria socialis]CAF4462994.1 unnamed protein product [Rotaria socialis]CAF4644479.1 unnamed protein product [Rotaria socialis]